MHYGPRPQYKILGEYPPDAVFPHIIKTDSDPGTRPYKASGKTWDVKMGSDRYYCFDKDPKCVCCGLTGETLLLEVLRRKGEPRAHFNFYARDEGELVLMTKDHIVAKANGGSDARDNLQTMCTVCNGLKGSDDVDMEELFKRRQRFNRMKIFQLRVLRKSKYLVLWEINYRHKSQKLTWEMISREKDRKKLEKQLYRGKKRPDAVVLVVMVGDKMVVTKEFRAPLGDYEYGFPAGLVDGNESPVSAAVRELKEETGLDVADVKEVSPLLFSSAGLTDEAVQMVYIEAKGELCTDGQEATEDITTMLLSREDVGRLLKQKDEFEDALFGAKSYLEMRRFAAGL